MKRFRIFAAGLLAGIVLAGSIPIFATVISTVQTSIVDYKIVLDGKKLDIPSDTAILNYNDRTYTPSRFVAESLGATVNWLPDTQTVEIISPTPKVVEKEVIKEVEKEVIKEVEKIVEKPSERDFLKLPVRYVSDDCYIEVNGVNAKSNYTELSVAVQNDYEMNVDVYVREADAYIVAPDGTKVSISNADFKFYSPIECNQTFESTLTFGGFNNTDDKLTVYIPFEIKNFATGKVEKKNVTFYIDFYDKEDNRSRR